jgi:hypothetical protein
MTYSIVGHRGEQINPQEHEARVILAGLEQQPDHMVMGQALALSQRFPMLPQVAQTINPRIASLLRAGVTNPAFHFAPGQANTAQPAVGAYVAHPQVGSSEPGPVGLSSIPMSQSTPIAAAATAVIVASPQSIFKPYKLVVDSVIMPFFLVSDFRIGTVPLFDFAGVTAATLYTPAAIPSLKKITANPGVQITLTVQNRDGASHPFYGSVYGEAAPTQCG